MKTLRSSDLPKHDGDLRGNGASSLNRGAMDSWLQQNATTFSPAGYRSQIQPKVDLPIPPLSGGSSMVRSVPFDVISLSPEQWF